MISDLPMLTSIFEATLNLSEKHLWSNVESNFLLLKFDFKKQLKLELNEGFVDKTMLSNFLCITLLHESIVTQLLSKRKASVINNLDFQNVENLAFHSSVKVSIVT